MARIARMPHVYFDRQKKRYFVERRVPPDVQAIVGHVKVKHVFKQEIDRVTANDLSFGIVKGWEAEWNRLRPQPPWCGIGRMMAESERRIAAAAAKVQVMIEAGDLTIPRKQDYLEMVLQGQELPRTKPTAAIDMCNPSSTACLIVEKPAEAHLVVHSEDVIRAWIDERNADGHTPKPKAVANKRRKLAHLLEHTKKSDIGQITRDDLLAYRRNLLSRGGTIANDYLSDIKALLRVAKRAGLIKVNPAEEIVVPSKPRNKRPPFSDAEAKAILEAAREAEPVVRWSNWLAAFTTAMNSEILGADASEFYQTESGQWVFDMRARKLKNECRPRIQPLHRSIIREGFPEYLVTRQGKKLFDGSPDTNSNRLNEFIHGIEIDGRPILKTFYSWRHRVTHRLDKLTSPSLSRYIAGHAAKDIHERFYLHHELPEEFGEIITAIEQLRDPTQSAGDPPCVWVGAVAGRG